MSTTTKKGNKKRTKSERSAVVRSVEDIILNGTNSERLALFSFSVKDDDELILHKFKLFARALYPRYFQFKDAPFHDEMILGFIKAYKGSKNFVNLGFRGCAKTTYKKLFDVFVLLNDEEGTRKHFKVLCKDGKNSRQIVTDVYNLIVEAVPLYGDVFLKEGDIKREETQQSFTMTDGRKYASGTVGQVQRGHIQDAYRPDYVWFEDIEDSESVRSLVITEGIIQKCEEAINGLSKDGNYVVNGNYISEYGSIQWFLNKAEIEKLITPIEVDGVPTWDYYTKEDISKKRRDAEDFYGEYMCDPARSDNKFFDIDLIEAQLKGVREPNRTSAGVKYWKDYQAHHRYAMGADTSEGIGRDSNTFVVMDFTTGEIVSTYHNNRIAPDIFGHEMARVGAEYGHCLLAPERNNTGMATITAIKDYPNLFREMTWGTVEEKETVRYGWNTNAKTKPTMLYDFRKAFNDGLIKIYDKDLLDEMRSYSIADLTDEQTNLVTRHFDLLIAACIAWQMNRHSAPAEMDADLTIMTDDWA